MGLIFWAQHLKSRKLFWAQRPKSSNLSPSALSAPGCVVWCTMRRGVVHQGGNFQSNKTTTDAQALGEPPLIEKVLQAGACCKCQSIASGPRCTMVAPPVCNCQSIASCARCTKVQLSKVTTVFMIPGCRLKLINFKVYLSTDDDNLKVVFRLTKALDMLL